MENTIEKFITELKELFDAEEEFYIVVDEEYNAIEYNDTANRLSGEACKYLICSDGRVNYHNRAKIENEGFKIYPGDKDSFGWLVGVIERNNRKLLFG